MARRPARRPSFGLGLGCLALVSLLLLGFAPTGSAAAAAAGPASGVSATVGEISTSATTFAARAGYAPGLLGAVPDPIPAGGSVELVVTFQPTSPSFFATPALGAKPLTVGEIAERFGLTTANYSAAILYFESQGLSVVRTWPDRLSLTLSGSEAAVGRAFGTSILSGSYQGRSVTFPATPPSLPAPLEDEVASVLGLSSGLDAFTIPALTGADAFLGGSSPTQGNGNLVTPAIARSIYDLSGLYNLTSSPTYASTRSIAIVLWGVGYAPSDLTTFFQQDYPSDFPAPTIVPEPIDGAPSPSESAVNDPCKVAQEMTLDLEWSGSMAPGATLYAVYPPESSAGSCQPSTAGMADAMHTAVGLPVSAISMSFGTPETSDSSLRSAWDVYFAEGVQEGITFLAATGDTGGDGSPPPGCLGGPNPQYPASSPDVLAVGGTDVSLERNLLGQITGFSESAWNQSGGGFSTQFPAPNWQSTTGNAHRGTPDVSATAADNFVYFDGATRTAGGTSFSTPLWAGLITEMDAIHGSSFGLIAPRLYSIGGAEPSGKIAVGLADITSGSTCLGTAGPGWDPETGWGSPRAVLLYEDLTATFVSLSLTVSPGSVGPGGTVTLSAHLANQTSGAAIAGVPVLVSLTSSTNLGPCTGTFGSADPSTDGNGNVSVTVSVPVCYLGSHAEAQVEVISDGYYGTNATSVAVNLLGFLPFLSGITQFPYNVLGFVAILTVAASVGYVLGRPRRGRPGAGGPATPSPPTTSPPASPGTSSPGGPSGAPPASTPPGTAGPPTGPASSPTPQKP